MIFKCTKCEFIFERKNDPAKCPSCDGPNIIDADKTEQKEFKARMKNKKDIK